MSTHISLLYDWPHFVLPFTPTKVGCGQNALVINKSSLSTVVQFTSLHKKIGVESHFYTYDSAAWIFLLVVLACKTQVVIKTIEYF